jgi:hypothetical protein
MIALNHMGIMRRLFCMFSMFLFSLQFTSPLVYIPFQLHSYGEDIIVCYEHDDTASDYLGNSQIHVLSFCKKHSLMMEHCDAVWSYISSKDYLTSNLLNDSSCLPVKSCGDPYDVILKDTKCVELQLVDHCCDLKLTPMECTSLYNKVMLERYEDIESLPVCPVRRPSSAGTSALVSSYPAVSTQSLNIWVFWDCGLEGMPSLVRYIFRHNLEIAQFYGHHLHLVTLDTLPRYLDTSQFHPAFSLLSPMQQADYLRLQLLFAHGGIWLDTDFVIHSNPASLWSLMTLRSHDVLITEEFPGKRTNALIVAQRGSAVLQHALATAHRALDAMVERRSRGLLYMWRDFIGPDVVADTVRHFQWSLYPSEGNHAGELVPGGILIVAHSACKEYVHFAAWILKPWCEYDTTWLKGSPELAAAAAEDIMRQPFAVVAMWTLASEENFMDQMVLYDTRSVFYQLFALSRQQMR